MTSQILVIGANINMEIAEESVEAYLSSSCQRTPLVRSTVLRNRERYFILGKVRDFNVYVDAPMITNILLNTNPHLRLVYFRLNNEICKISANR